MPLCLILDPIWGNGRKNTVQPLKKQGAHSESVVAGTVVAVSYVTIHNGSFPATKKEMENGAVGWRSYS